MISNLIAGLVGISSPLVYILVFIIATLETARSRLQARESTREARGIGGRFSRQLGFLVRRFETSSSRGRAPTLLLAAGAVLLYGFLSVTEDVVTTGEKVALDGPVSNFLIGSRAPWLTRVMLMLTQLGNTAVLAPTLVAVAVVVFLLRRTWKPGAFLAFVVVGAVIASSVLKVVIVRPRPTAAALVQATGYAFPSGHATAAAAAWLAIAMVLGQLTQRWLWRVVSFAAAVTLVALVGVSRVYLGVHEPSDVLAGWALGSMWVLTGLAVVHPQRMARKARC